MSSRQAEEGQRSQKHGKSREGSSQDEGWHRGHGVTQGKHGGAGRAVTNRGGEGMSSPTPPSCESFIPVLNDTADEGD